MKIPIIILTGLMCLVHGKLKLDPKVFEELQDHPKLSVFISFRSSNTGGIRETFASFKHTLSTRASKINTLYKLLKDHADATQRNVRSFLEDQNTDKSLKIFTSWMTNELIVKGIDKERIAALEEMDDIREIRADRLRNFYEPVVSSPLSENNGNSIQWGVSIHAPEVWAIGYRGEGAVVATIDTGVRGTHEALRDNYRRQNGWFDPIDGDVSPSDYRGHGTHTMGTLVGQTNGIGVAPQSNWISCKGCDQGCWDSDLIICGNFMGCPTDVNGENPNCELAPSLVSNSWGGGQGDHFYDEIISTWILMNIVPFFSAGNYGREGCETVVSPADNIEAIAVGATDTSNKVTDFSSRGPTFWGMKPEVSAPGSYVMSSYNSGDEAYKEFKGTSMACPHAAGVAALLYSKKPNLSFSEVKAAIISGAHSTSSIDETCGSIPDSTYPNNHVGAGRVDALASVKYIDRVFIPI